MVEKRDQHKPHFILENTASSELFQPRAGGGGSAKTPLRDRQQHGKQLLKQLEALKPDIEQAVSQQKSAGLEDGFGLQIAFESFPEIELAFESLASEGSGIELLNVRHENESTYASIFIPDGKLHIFENKILSYLDESKDSKKGIPKNQKLLDAIRNIHAASLKALWTDDPAIFPESDDETFWWEVWLPVRDNRAAVVDSFKKLAEGLGFRVAGGELQFPERTVLLVFASVSQMKRSILTLNSIAELRRAKETADFFDSLSPNEQPEWLDDLLQRTIMPNEHSHVPHVCLLDTGVNNGHPLIATALANRDLHTIDPAWGANDDEGHGTEMAGLALTGNLTNLLDSSDPVSITHRLESVKLLPRDNANHGDPDHHGYLTIQAVARPEITAPNRSRVFSMAITTKDGRDRGKPSAWSSTIDRLAVDYENQGETPRLFVISAGNIDDPNAWENYPDSNSTDGIHDPGQAWNALTVGASTDLIHITESDTDDYQPIAPAGGLSPFSTTSQTWQPRWPFKPDVVFEGGNAALDAISAVTMPSLKLLTTNADFTQHLLTTTNATSAASALAARMAAQLMAEYPQLKPETIRGLMVHSAEWTPEMRQQFLPLTGSPNKTQMMNLVRHCGFGQPNLERAWWSVENSLTLICEEKLQPFQREGSNQPKLRDMNLHHLPWPLEELEALGETEVEMRVTLSYFIEPNPSARGVTSRYRYESHGLRFDVKRSSESVLEFRTRINQAARDENEQTQTNSSNDPCWQIGSKNRHKGSLHSDIWIGSAADLASRGVLAVYPVTGWWKTRPRLERYDQFSRYSLLISIRVPEVDVSVSLYSAIANRIKTTIKI